MIFTLSTVYSQWGQHTKNMSMDLLSDILSKLRLEGTLYFRTSFTSPWGVKVPSYSDVARFHFAHKGRCMVRIADNEAPVTLEQGDLIIIMRGAAHTLYCDPVNELDALPLDEIIQKSGFTGKGVLVWGEHGAHHETQLVCGHFAFEKHASHPMIGALPDYIKIKNYGEGLGAWLEQSLRVIGAEACRDSPGADIVALKMSEIIFAQSLRVHLEADGKNVAVLAGLSDPKISKALRAIHEEPAHYWTLEELARIAGQSRTSFATHFSSLMAMTPISYITDWRMQLARQMLVDTNDAIIAIAENTGYQSEAAFGRVFKRTFSVAPVAYRKTFQKGYDL